MENSTKTPPAVVCISGLKNSGKTALIEALIPLLAKAGIRTAVIKHHGHGFEDEIPDKPGTDTYRFLACGASGTVIYDDTMLALVKRQNARLEDLIALFPESDLILIEGAKEADWPRIAMLRTGQPFIYATQKNGSPFPANTLLCAVTDPDYDASALPAGLPRFDFGDFESAAALLVNHLSSIREV